MEEQYKNDESLVKALFSLHCFENIELYDSKIKETDKSTDTLIDTALDSQNLERQEAIDECIKEVETTMRIFRTDMIPALTKVKERFHQSGMLGDVSSEWLSLCRILSPEDALDAVKHYRTECIWEFFNAIQKRYDTIPFFNKIKEDLKQSGQIKLEGKNAINDYFLQALRDTAKKQAGFKELIRRLNLTSVSVLGNNKFKVTNMFIYKFIRIFTQHKESRTGNIQSFTITSIGPFGYDYQINALRTSTTKLKLKRRAA